MNQKLLVQWKVAARQVIFCTYCSTPQGTLMTDALLTCATEHTEFLMMNITSATQSKVTVSDFEMLSNV